jgi:oligoribonuclease NrnB/cAMP/cGMP phosphodiesterase (DHH superfamily)
MSVPLVIYHGNCQDGFTAAWAVWKVHPDWGFYAAKHGDPPPDLTGIDTVYMVDFSYKRPVILEMATPEKTIIILDHHKTAEADLVDLPSNVSVTFDMERSGAHIAWDHFHPHEPLPSIIRTVEDRDLWRFKYPTTKAISAALFAEEYNFITWTLWDQKIQLEGAQWAVESGEAILRKAAKDTNELLQNKFKSSIGGHDIWVCNLPYTFSSDAGNILASEPGAPFGATFYLDGEYAVFSLRSTEEGLDVSEIAKQYGGGGHKHAAGFKVPYPFRRTA